MKIQMISLLLSSCLLACTSTTTEQDSAQEKISYLPEDKEILEEVLKLYATDSKASTSALLIKVGSFFLETPYVAHTLEQEDEHLVINLRELDCTTFAENCLAIARTIKNEDQSFEQFCKELQFIRYRNGRIEGYPSRLHYFCDWIFHNEQKKLITHKSEEFAATPFSKEINFMSKHPENYRQLQDSIPLVESITAQEKEINARKMFFIPETRVAGLESSFMDGDIAGITTNIDGIAIQHVVLLIRKEGRVHIMHASSKAEKVILSENTLEDYLLNSKSATGIMLVRPL